MKTDYQYFTEHVNVTEGCWFWTGALSARGYGRFTRSRYNRHRAHRWSYEYFVGKIPEGLTLDHLCKVKSCVNPKHLEPVTAEENARRYHQGRPDLYDWENGRCKKGHELKVVGFRERPKKGRECMGCRREQNKRYYYNSGYRAVS